MLCISYLFCLDTVHTVHFQRHRLPSEKAFLLIIFSFLHSGLIISRILYIGNHMIITLIPKSSVALGNRTHTTRNMLTKITCFALTFSLSFNFLISYSHKLSRVCQAISHLQDVGCGLFTSRQDSSGETYPKNWHVSVTASHHPQKQQHPRVHQGF